MTFVFPNNDRPPMIQETQPYPGLTTNEDGPLRRWGSRCADRRSCHHAASTTAKAASPAISGCAMNAGLRHYCVG